MWLIELDDAQLQSCLGLTLEDIADLRGKVTLPLRFEINETPIVKSRESWDDFYTTQDNRRRGDW